jgi:hypothetical protein
LLSLIILTRGGCHRGRRSFVSGGLLKRWQRIELSFADAISIQEFITADSDALLLVSELKSAFFKHSEYFSRRLAWACSCLKPSAKAPVIGAKARKLLQ